MVNLKINKALKQMNNNKQIQQSKQGAERESTHYEVDELKKIMEKAQKLLIDSLEKLIPTKPKVTVSKHRLYFEPNYESALRVAEELLHHWRQAAFIITSNKIVSGENETSGRAMVIIPPESANRLAPCF